MVRGLQKGLQNGFKIRSQTQLRRGRPLESLLEASWALLEPKRSGLGALLRAPKSRLAEKPKIPWRALGLLGRPGCSSVALGWHRLGTTFQAATEISGNQRKSAHLSANQPQRNSAQGSKLIVSGTVSSRSAYYFYYYSYYHYDY